MVASWNNYHRRRHNERRRNRAIARKTRILPADALRLEEVIQLGTKIREEAALQDPFDTEETATLLKQWDLLVARIYKEHQETKNV